MKNYFILLMIILFSCCNDKDNTKTFKIEYKDSYSGYLSFIIEVNKNNSGVFYNRCTFHNWTEYKHYYQLKIDDNMFDSTNKITSLSLFRKDTLTFTEFNFRYIKWKNKIVYSLKPVIPETSIFLETKLFNINSNDEIEVSKFLFDKSDSMHSCEAYYVDNIGFICYVGTKMRFMYEIKKIEGASYKESEILNLIQMVKKDTSFFHSNEDIDFKFPKDVLDQILNNK